jgi:hypothetical protein
MRNGRLWTCHGSLPRLILSRERSEVEDGYKVKESHEKNILTSSSRSFLLIL